MSQTSDPLARPEQICPHIVRNLLIFSIFVESGVSGCGFGYVICVDFCFGCDYDCDCDFVDRKIFC